MKNLKILNNISQIGGQSNGGMTVGIIMGVLGMAMFGIAEAICSPKETDSAGRQKCSKEATQKIEWYILRIGGPIMFLIGCVIFFFASADTGR